MPTFTAAEVVNTALQYIAAQTQISALNDDSVAANAATTVYAPVVQLLLREIEPDFASASVALTLSGASVTPPPWAYEYLYPTDCVRLRQVRPASYDPLNPLPVRSQVGFDIIAAVPTRIILTNQGGAVAVYTTSNVTETQWDSGFAEAVARRLANPLAMALAGRPDFAREILEEAERVAAACEPMDDGSFGVMQ